jgi:hypothetical protein
VGGHVDVDGDVTLAMLRASAVTTGGTSIRVPMTFERAASRARSSWRAT